jgi:hypothetical protein
MNLPKDHTEFLMAYIGTVKSMHKVITVWYADYDKYDNLPDLVKSEEIKKEYEKFWKWRKQSVY